MVSSLIGESNRIFDQLSRFLALMNNFSIATDATTMSMDSQGSSMREQEKFADSLQGRINRLDTAWNKLTLSTGQAVLTDGLISAVETLNDLATVTAKGIDLFGVLSGVFGILGGATVLLSTRFRTFTTSLIFGTQGMTRAQLASAGLTASMGRLGIATIGASTALRGLAAATGVGLIFVGIGFAIEKLIGLYSNAKQAQEEFEASQQKNIEALTSNKEQTESLIESYKALSNQRENGNWNNEKEKEYLRIQQQLGEIYPSLISSMSATGQYHLTSADNIDKEVAKTKELLELKKEEIRLNALQTFEDNIGEREGFFGLEREIRQKRKQIDELVRLEADQTIINQAKQELLQLESEFATTSAKINDEVLKVADAYKEFEIDPTISRSVQDFVNSLDLTGLDSSELEQYSIKLASLMDNMQKAYEFGDSDEFESARKSLLDYSNQMSATEVNAKTLGISFEKVKEENERLANATYAGADGMGAVETAMDGATESASDLVGAQDELKSSTERLMGVSDQTIDSVYEMIGVYELLSKMENLSADQKKQLTEATSFLASIYPDLVAGSNANIEMMKKEIESTDILRQAINKMAEGEVSAQDQMTIATAIGTKNRLNLLRKEIQAYNEFFAQVEEKGKETGFAFSANTLEAEKLATRRYRTISVDIDSLTADLDKYTGSLSKSLDINGKYTESLKESAKEYERSAYVSDKFKAALERINLELERQQAIQAKQPEHSKKYQSALKQELKLLEQKKDLLESQAKSLERQIKAGNIQQTGIIQSASSSSPSTSSRATGGGNSATIWNFFKSKGFSDAITAGIMGNLRMESNLNPNALNASSGAFGIAQWLGGRKSSLQNYASSIGSSANNLMTQLNFLWKELQSTEKRTMNWIRSNPNASASTTAAMFDKLFERSEGTHIPQRQNYANQYLSQYSGSGGSYVVASTSDTSKAYAEQLQSVDQAKSELNQLRSEILNIDSLIAEKQLEMLKLPITRLENQFQEIQDNIDLTEGSMFKLTEGTVAYGNALRKQREYVKQKQSVNEQEIAYIRELISSGKLSAIQVDELNQQLIELLKRRQEIGQTRESLSDAIVGNGVAYYTKQIEDLNYELENSRLLQDMMNEDSSEFIAENNKQIDLLKDKQDLLKQQIAALNTLIDKQGLSGNEALKYADKVKELSRELLNANVELHNLQKTINQGIADNLTGIRDSYFESLREELDKDIETLESSIDAAEKQYDALIEQQQERLDMLDEEIEKEDRLKAIREINEQIENAKNDKRFSYITENGEEILTYNKEQVSELEKQKDEMLKQYEREDVKKAIQDEIDRLEKAKNDRVTKIQEEIESTRQKYDELVKLEEERWEDLIYEAQNGTANFEEMLSEWYGVNLEGLSKHVSDVNSQIGLLMEAYAKLRELQSNPPSGGSSGGSNNPLGMSDADYERYMWNKERYANNTNRKQAMEENQRLRDRYGITEDTIPVHHEGGIIGSPSNKSKLAVLANKFLNTDLKSNETLTKSLIGEIQVPPKNISNVFKNINTLVGSILPKSSPVIAQAGDSYQFSNFTIKADNPQDLFSQLQTMAIMKKR